MPEPTPQAPPALEHRCTSCGRPCATPDFYGCEWCAPEEGP